MTPEEEARAEKIRMEIITVGVSVLDHFKANDVQPAVAELACLYVLGLSRGMRGLPVKLSPTHLKIVEIGWTSSQTLRAFHEAEKPEKEVH